MEEQEIITCPRVILCEGAGDAAFLKHLIRERQLPEFHITYSNHVSPQHSGGRDGFTGRLKALRLIRGYSQVTDLIVMSDNDNDPAGNFAQVCTLIRAVEGLPIPAKPGEMTKAGKPHVGVYMLPAPDLTGQLETLCLQSCLARWPDRAACLEAFVACNPHIALWDQNKQEKMKMRVLISSICSSDPYTSLTHAWSKTEAIIPLDNPCFEGLATFLSSVPAPELKLKE